MRRTKIVCTIGPATNSKEMITHLIRAGMDVARLNFSHGSHDDHRKVVQHIRSISKELNKPITILQDLQGPKLRIGNVENGMIQLKKEDQVAITTDYSILGTKELISTSYEQLPRDVKIGDRILLDDGLIQLKVKKVEQEKTICEVIEGGDLSDHKGINLPGVAISQPSLTEKDRSDLAFGIEQDVDSVAMSFVRHPDDVRQVKEIINAKGKDILVVAKLEKPEAINQLDEIIDIADGVMVARGDLGVELPLETVPPLQKEIIQKAIQKGKPVITATQMLESMRGHARPTRAEVSDVANAIFDGTDAVMLSAETAVGKFPVETVETMSRIIEQAEKTSSKHVSFSKAEVTEECLSVPDAISISACRVTEQLNIKAIVAFTTSGFTAKMVAHHRPRTPIIAFTPEEVIRRQLNLVWGVVPLNMEFLNNTDEIVAKTEQILLDKGFVRKGDMVIILLGAPVYIKGTTNLMKLHKIGEA